MTECAFVDPIGELSFIDDVCETPAATVWYVSNAGDDDNNNGRTEVSPYATLERLSEADVLGTDTVYLHRGSTFREELTDLPDGITVRAYGTGALPIIDGRDIADNAEFSATVGQTNVYEIAWTHSFDAAGGKAKHSAWEDGTRLTRETSIANCESTAGSFYAADPTTGGPDTIYVHPTGSTNPATDGKVYSFSARKWCVELRDHYLHASVYELDTIGNAHADGSLCVDGHSEDCTPRDGRIHNAFIVGEAVRCRATGIDTSAGFAMFASYIDTSTPGPTARHTIYRGCVADAGQETAIGDGFLVHTDNVRFFGTVYYEDCEAIDCNGGYSGIQADTFLYYRCRATGSTTSIASVGTTRTVVLGGELQLRDASNTRLYHTTAAAAEFELLMHGVKGHKIAGGLGPIEIDAPNCTATIERCTIATASGGSVWLRDGTFTINRNVITGQNLQCVRLADSPAQVAGFVADQNAYWTESVSEGAFRSDFGGIVTYNTIADWRSYLAGVSLGPETNSIAVDPQLADPANGDFTIGNAAVLALGAGAEPDEEDDAELQAYLTTYTTGVAA